MSSSRALLAAAAAAAALALGACTPDLGPPRPYYDRVIQPILSSRCVNAGGGVCHTSDGAGRAMGNLDLSSFETVTRRRDVLRRFGPYPYPLLLLKGVADRPGAPFVVNLGDVVDVPLAIRHAGGSLFDPMGHEFFTLALWLENGATRDGLPPPPPEPVDYGPCPTEIRTDLFSQTSLDAVDTTAPDYRAFTDDIYPTLIKPGCVGRVCHGVRDTNKVPTLELYFTCDDDDRQQRFNYLMARTYVGAGGRGALTEKALTGGSWHAGGKQFASVEDPDYRRLRAWSETTTPLPLVSDEGEAFFRANVQPALIAPGCYLEGCHSLTNFNFYKPLAGTDGLFGTRSMRHNYLQARFMLGLEAPDPNEGRLIKKNLLPASGGIPHKGGPVLEPRGPCALDPLAVRADPGRRWFAEADAACVLATWHRLERLIAIDNGQLDATPGAVAVFVRRPPNADRLIDFATYRPGADLLRVDLARDAAGRVTGLAGGPQSLLGGCGVVAADADVRRPDLSADGSEVIFAMRTAASEGLDLWRVGADGSDCRRLGLAGGVDAAGTPIHHFDPAFGPGGIILFASTRGDDAHADQAARGYPSRTPREFLPNSNIWLVAPGGQPQRLSYLNGAELTPRLLHTREVIYGVEKVAPSFYQISTRAIRLDDGGGYRPQLGQRPTMGYGQVTEMAELVDFRTVYIASDPGALFAGGTLGVQDLSLGLEELAYQDAGFFHSTRVLDAGAAARPGQPGTGAYRSPAPMPGGQILVAYSPGMVDLGDPTAAVDYGLWVVDPSGRAPAFLLYDTPGQFDLDPAVAYPRIYVPQPNRLHQTELPPIFPTDQGEVVFHSLPLFAALLNGNSRVGTAPNDDVVAVRVLEQLAPPEGATSAADVPAADLHDGVYVKLRLIGEAPLLADGSIRLLVPSRTPLVLQLLDAGGNVIDWQREEEQVGPGETQPRLIAEPQFDAVCGGCHNARDGSEVNATIGPDVITAASTTSAASAPDSVVNLYLPPAERVDAPFP